MQLVLVAIASAVSLAAIALLSALRLSVDARALGHPNGTWALAFGLELGVVQFAGVIGSAAPGALEMRVLGRKISFERWLRRRSSAVRPEPPAPSPSPNAKRRRLPAWLDPVDLVVFLADERRHLAIEALDIDLDYGFRDVALTGKLAGVLYALGGVLPPPVRVNQRPSFEGGETWQAHIGGRVALWPGLVLFEVLWYMLRARLRYRPAAATTPAPEPGPAA